MLAQKGYSFDSYESNWKILKIEKRDGKDIFFISYIDIFQFVDYEKLKYYLTQILLKINK